MNYRTYNPNREEVDKRLKAIRSELSHITELIEGDGTLLSFPDVLIVDNILENVENVIRKLNTK